MMYDHPIAALDATLVPARLEGPVGVFVDGENLQSWAAERIRRLGKDHPALRLCRVYGNYDHLNDWRRTPGFEVIHTGVAGSVGDAMKNAADIKIAVDVMEFALRNHGRTVVLCSSDRDFTPLVVTLRRLGSVVIGAGEPKASATFKEACHAYIDLTKSVEKASDREIFKAVTEVFRTAQLDDGWIKLQEFGTLMKDRGIPTARLTDCNWSAYLTKKPDLYELRADGTSNWVKKRESAKQPL